MKLKNVSFVDRTLHKIAPLVALLFLLLVLYFYVLGEPYQVVLQQGGNPVPSEQIEEEIQRAASRLEKKIYSSENPLKIPMKLIPYTEEFQARSLRSLVGKTSFEVPLGPPGLDSKVFTPTPLPPSEYMVHLPPPATDVKARPTYGVLALPQTPPEARGAWTSLVGDTEPHDIRIVTVTGAFDLTEWRRRLTGAPVGQRITIPENWWRTMLAITDVVLERQQLDPETGKWGPTEKLSPLPNNSFAYLRQQGDNFTGTDALEIIRTVNNSQDPIRHAPPPPLTNDHPWVPPGAEAKLTPEQWKRLADLEEDIARVQEQKERFAAGQGGGPHTAQPAHTPAPGQGSAHPAGGAAEHPKSQEEHHPAAVPHPLAPSSAHAPTADPAVEREKLAEELNDMQAERSALRLGKTYVKGQAATGGDHHGHHDHPNPEGGEQVQVWAHDVTAKPGMTYRYRILISVLDPLFQRPNLNPQQRADYFQTLALTSDPDQDENEKFRGAWSDPVEIDRDSYFFLTNANPGGRSVTVEVWHLFNGAWRPRDFSVRPGDIIGQIATLPGFTKPIDMSVNAIAVDIDPISPTDRPLVRTTPKLIYLDTASGKLLSRTLVDDREDQRFLRFKSQAQPPGPVAEKQ